MADEPALMVCASSKTSVIRAQAEIQKRAQALQNVRSVFVSAKHSEIQ
jgi:hypothetical protein